MAKKTQKKTKATKTALTPFTKVLIVIAAIAAIFLLACVVRYMDSQSNPMPPQDTTGVSMRGEIVCLPHKGDGPHTLECAYGLRDDEGNHFALQDVAIEDTPETGMQVQVDGTLETVDQNDESQPYDIEAIIRYANIEVLE